MKHEAYRGEMKQDATLNAGLDDSSSRDDDGYWIARGSARKTITRDFFGREEGNGFSLPPTAG
jgi:hypothetical protein